jgi:hypothetical protein
MRRTAAALGIATTTFSLALPMAPAHAADATVSVLHAVPGLTVDVYANGEELIPDFTPGTLTDPLTLPEGSYELAVYADGDTPDTADPAIEANGVEVPGGANATVVAHLDADGNPTLSLFANDTAPIPPGDARLTVRHTAAAPAVDVRADGQPLFRDLANPGESSADVPAGTYAAGVALAGTEDVVIGPADLDLAEGTHTVVYAWGSAGDDNLALAVQTISGMHSAPAGVPAGEAGLAAEPELPTWALGLGLASVLALLVAGRRLVASPQGAARR